MAEFSQLRYMTSQSLAVDVIRSLNQKKKSELGWLEYNFHQNFIPNVLVVIFKE